MLYPAELRARASSGHRRGDVPAAAERRSIPPDGVDRTALPSCNRPDIPMPVVKRAAGSPTAASPPVFAVYQIPLRPPTCGRVGRVVDNGPHRAKNRPSRRRATESYVVVSCPNANDHAARAPQRLGGHPVRRPGGPAHDRDPQRHAGGRVEAGRRPPVRPPRRPCPGCAHGAAHRRRAVPRRPGRGRGSTRRCLTGRPRRPRPADRPGCSIRLSSSTSTSSTSRCSRTKQRYRPSRLRNWLPAPHAAVDDLERSRRQDRLLWAGSHWDPLPLDADVARAYGRRSAGRLFRRSP